MAYLVTLHELGHNYGSPHDPNTADCTPACGLRWWCTSGQGVGCTLLLSRECGLVLTGAAGGHFIMNALAVDGSCEAMLARN